MDYYAQGSRVTALRETARTARGWRTPLESNPAVIFAVPEPLVSDADMRDEWLARMRSEVPQVLTPHEKSHLASLLLNLAELEQRVAAAAAQPGSPAWLAYGDEPWLVTVTASELPVSAVVIGVSSRAVAPPGTTLVAGSTPTSFRQDRGS
jgi:hypothetical protein